MCGGEPHLLFIFFSFLLYLSFVIPANCSPVFIVRVLGVIAIVWCNVVEFRLTDERISKFAVYLVVAGKRLSFVVSPVCIFFISLLISE